MKRPELGSAVFYTRDSGGRHEMTPGEYVGWAQRRADELGLSFRGTPETIASLIREGRSCEADIYVDYKVQGHILSRAALDALIKRVQMDPQVSHVFIPRRDRFARPDDPLDAMALEKQLSNLGVTLVFMGRTVKPRARGKRPDIAETVTALIEYDQSGKDRRDLAQKILFAQLRLAKKGYSTGGRAPYGFRRHLVQDDGKVVRSLRDGERVRMAGHHVVWLPGSEAELLIIRRILEMIETMPAARIAAVLTAEGVRTPDHERCRTDRGVHHQTSGVWHQTTITGIVRNFLLRALVLYGQRSMGDQLRFSHSGPRELSEDDFRLDEKPKVIRNAPEQCVTAPAAFPPLLDLEQHQKIVAILEQRGGTQRGKPRSKDPANNPLGSRIFDMNCGWPMYREPYNGSFRYKCGYYQQSHGAACSHNHVDGVLAARFMLSCLRQQMLSRTLLPKVKERLRQIAEQERNSSRVESSMAKLRGDLAKVEQELQSVIQNLARAKTPAQYEAVSAVFDQLTERRGALAAEIAKADEAMTVQPDVESEVRAALGLAERLTELIAERESTAAAREVFDLTNARLFLKFQPTQPKKRVVQKVVSGVVTFGAAPPPIAIYAGPTARKKIRNPATMAVAGPCGLDLPAPPERSIGSGEEGESLGNVSRGDWTPVELFRRGVATWNHGVRRLLIACCNGAATVG